MLASLIGLRAFLTAIGFWGKNLPNTTLSLRSAQRYKASLLTLDERLKSVARHMNVYTYTEACQNLASLLDQAAEEGEVQIMRRDGRAFVVKPQERSGAPLNIKGIDIKLSLSEILGSIEEGCMSV